jgi:hypothetical protein
MACPGFNPPRSEVRRVNHCAIGAQNYFPLYISMKYYFIYAESKNCFKLILDTKSFVLKQNFLWSRVSLEQFSMNNFLCYITFQIILGKSKEQRHDYLSVGHSDLIV